MINDRLGPKTSMRSSCGKRNGKAHTIRQDSEMVKNIKSGMTLIHTDIAPIILVCIGPIWGTSNGKIVKIFHALFFPWRICSHHTYKMFRVAREKGLG